MNRPALKALLPYLFGGIVASHFITPHSELIPYLSFYSWLFAAISVLWGIFIYRKQYLRVSSILFGLSLFALGFFRYQTAMYSPIPPELYNQKVCLKGYVTYNPDQPDSEELRTPSSNISIYISGFFAPPNTTGRKTKILIRGGAFPTYNQKKLSQQNKKVADAMRSLRYGDVVEVRGELLQPNTKRNPGGFDYQAYLARRGVFGIIYLRDAADLRKVGSGGGYFWMRWMDRLRGKVEGIFEQTMEGTVYANILKGIILGQRKKVPEEILSDFRDSGIMHILVVSGLHVGMIALAGFLLFKLFRIPEKFIHALTIAIIIVYACIVGYRPSVVRASIIIILYLIARIIDRDYDLLNLLSLAALLLLLFNFASLWDVGFQLSFITTAAIIYFMSKWDVLFIRLPPKQPYSSIKKFLLLPFSVSASAQAVSQPILAYHFNRVYTFAILTNLVAVWLVWYIVCVAFVTTIVGLFWTPLALPFAYANQLAIWALLKVVHFFAEIPYAVVDVPTPSFRFFVLYTVILFAIANIGFILREKEKSIIIAVAVISLCLWLTVLQPSSRFLKVTFLDVGQGDSAFVHFPDGKNMLIDGGPRTENYDSGERIIKPFLRHQGIHSIDTVTLTRSQIDAVILTHPQNDHGGGLTFILEHFRVGKIIGILPQDVPIPLNRELRGIAEENDIDITLHTDFVGPLSMSATESEEDEASPKGKVSVEILHPSNPNFTDVSSANLNNNSVVMKLRYGHITFLFTGDIETEAESAMLKAGTNLQADILKVPHHGSATSSTEAFLDAVNPAIAVISLRKGRFDFPSRAVLARYQRHGIQLFRTDESGAITIITDGQRCWFRITNYEVRITN